MVSSVARAVGRRVIQGSPGPSRPLRLVPVRSRRLADQFHRSDFNHESSTQENDHSIHVDGQSENTGNINNQLGNGSGGSTAGDFSIVPAPVIQTTISTTINPIYNRPHRRFRGRPITSDYEYELYEYYDEIEPVRYNRPARRRSHHRRKHVQTQVVTTTVPPTSNSPTTSKSDLLQDLISRGLIDPKDLLSSGYFSDIPLNQTGTSRKRRAIDSDTEATVTETDLVEPEILNPDYIGYDDYLSSQRDQLWDQIIPIMVAYELDFNIQVTVSNEPITGIYTPIQTLQVTQLRNPYPIRSRHRRSDQSGRVETNPMTARNSTSYIEIRNITRNSYEKTSISSVSHLSYHFNYQAICSCFVVIIVIFAIYRYRHNVSSA